MERDPQISKIMKEGGVLQAPEGFTARVMEHLPDESFSQKNYTPLIGKKGCVLIALFVITVITLALVAFSGDTEPASNGMDLFRNYQLNLPEWKIDLGFLNSLKPSAGVAAALLALFILVLSDARMNRRHRFI